MSVTAIGTYQVRPLDRQENFNGKQLVYLGWQRHLLFCAPMTFPLPPEMTFGEFIDQVVKPAIQTHPDAARVDFTIAQWQVDGESIQPDLASSLVANGIAHKSYVFLTTPGLDGIGGSSN